MSGDWTPGPWVMFDFGGNIVSEFAGFGICKQGTSLTIMMGDDSGLVCLYEGDHPTDRANAKLMALAPEMYEYIASSASNGCATAIALLNKAQP